MEFLKKFYFSHQESQWKDHPHGKMIMKKRTENFENILGKSFPHSLYSLARAIEIFEAPLSIQCSLEETIRITQAEDLSDQQKKSLEEILEGLKPWRLGPWEYFGREIQSEWRSSMKYDLLKEALKKNFSQGLEGKRLADVGCNNGYFLFRLAHESLGQGGIPKAVVGFEPLPKHLLSYYWHQKLLRCQNTGFELFGVDEMEIFEEAFDGVVCMGVLYHRRHPLFSLENMRKALIPGGTLFLETMIIPGEGEEILFPRKYLLSEGYWFLPMRKALENMLLRTGFEEIQILNIRTSSSLEQRKTLWSPGYSLEDFVEKGGEKTHEGYPAPLRIFLEARKKKTKSNKKIF